MVTWCSCVTWSLCPSATMPIRSKLVQSTVICTLVSGGGQCKCVIYCTHWFKHLCLVLKSLKLWQLGATVILVILSLDKTQVTLFYSKAAHPVYITISNIPKEIWEHFPLTNIFVSVIPDILHQMLQGIIKHLIVWLTSSAVFGPDVIDARCQMLPPNHQIRTFSNGIMTLSQISGQKHKDICCILLGLIVELSPPLNKSPHALLVL